MLYIPYIPQFFFELRNLFHSTGQLLEFPSIRITSVDLNAYSSEIKDLRS